ncbi:uncharacterized protein V6R79_008130 [Siganus canaliculatus]
MINVMGPDGAALVHRPWTDADMISALHHLPDCKASGTKFRSALQDFCREFMPTMPELRRLLMKQMGPTNYTQIRAACDGDERPVHPDWTHNDNAAYRARVETVGRAVEAANPDRVDMSKITSCKQKPGEPVNDYYHRLLQLFNENSGLAEPAVKGDSAGVWEVHLKQCFLAGLQASIRAGVELSCVGLHDARLAEVKRHAEHADDVQQRRKDKDTKKKEEQLHLAQMTMLQAVSPTPEPQQRHHPRGRGGRGRGRGRGRGHLGGRQNDGACYVCGSANHWAAACPQRHGGPGGVMGQKQQAD